MKIESFLERILAFLRKILKLETSPTVKILAGDQYTLRVLEDLEGLHDEVRLPFDIAKLAYHSVGDLYYWAEGIKNSDIALENTNRSYKVRYLSFSAWSLIRKKIPKTEVKQYTYTHVFCIWEAGRFRNGEFVLGRHLISIPIDLGVYGDRFIAAVANESSKKLLELPNSSSTNLANLDWNSIVLCYRNQYYH